MVWPGRLVENFYRISRREEIDEGADLGRDVAALGIDRVDRCRLDLEVVEAGFEPARAQGGC